MCSSEVSQHICTDNLILKKKKEMWDKRSVEEGVSLQVQTIQVAQRDSLVNW